MDTTTSKTPPPEFISKANVIDRIDSGETDESPFSSNLVTPTDEQEHLTRGIHERFDIANTVMGYFGPQSLSGEGKITYEEPPSDVLKMQKAPNEMQVASDSVVESIGAIGESPSLEQNIQLDDDQKPSIMSTLPSVISSLSSSNSVVRLQSKRESFYNLPNAHIVAEELHKTTEVEKSSDNVSEGSMHIPEDKGPMVEMDSDPWLSLTRAILESSMDLLFPTLRLAFFLPWCVAVGGALIFSPECLELLAFGTGYIKPLSGIRRYSHWATYGFQHIMSFFTLIGAVVWLYPTVGYLAIGGLLAQFCFTWHNFLVDSTIPLGENDRQTVFLLATTTWLNHDKSIHIKEANGSYYYSTRSLTNDPGLLDDSDQDVSG